MKGETSPKNFPSPKNFRLTIEYDGTGYNGWQAQSALQRRKGGRVRAIQSVLEDALFEIFSKRVNLVSSGRTDSGVHAKAHPANFKIETELQPIQIKKALNSILPNDIVIVDAAEVGRDFHAQNDALSKAYRYTICNQYYFSPFGRHYAYHFKQPLDVSIMRKEAKTLLGRHDFVSFKTCNGENGNCVRTVKRIDIRKKGGFIEIKIEADGFLYNMARNIVGTLIEIGRGKYPPRSMKKILAAKNRRAAGPTVPAKGLCLMEVKYR